MSRFADPSIVSHYQFSRSTGSTSRPQSSIPAKDAVNDMFNMGIDNRNELQRTDALPLSARRLTRHPVHIPTASLVVSPSMPYPRSSTPERTVTPERPPSASKGFRLSRSISVRLTTPTLNIPTSASVAEPEYQNFPKQNHEKRKAAQDRKRKKYPQIYSNKSAQTETWLRLRRSLVELKRLATTQDILIDPCTALFNTDNLTCTTVKQATRDVQEEKRAAAFKSESGISASFGAVPASHEFGRSSLTASQSSFSRPMSAKRPTETYPRLVFEPLVVASKPIHSAVDKTIPPVVKPRARPPSTAPPRSRASLSATRAAEEKQPEVLVTDHSSDDVPSLPPTPPPPPPLPPVMKTDPEHSSGKIVTPTRTRPPSTMSITSTIKLKTPIGRCRSATEGKPSFSSSKNYPRFIIIADEEHRIESWYHQYPFVLGDDLLSSFESKPSQQKLTTISAYFIDDLQTSNPNVSAKTFLQGKPFHVNNDWKKYDVVFISANVYEQVMNYLKTIINLIHSSGRVIKVYKVHHEEDLKTQVRSKCKQVQQQHV